MANTITIALDNLREDERAKLMEIIEISEHRRESVWKPQCGEKYWIVGSSSVDIYNATWSDSNGDLLRYEIGNCFKSKEDAEFALEKLKVLAELRRFAKENNPPDFNNMCRETQKWYLYMSVIDMKVLKSYSYSCLPPEITFATASLANKAINTIGEDRLRKYYFGVKEETADI